MLFFLKKMSDNHNFALVMTFVYFLKLNIMIDIETKLFCWETGWRRL